MFGRILTAAVTPFAADGSINVEAFRQLCSYLIEQGSDGIVVAGTTGESPTLTDAERVALIHAAVETVGGRAPVIAGTGTYSTRHSIELTREADAAGADAFLIVTPYYSKPPARGVVAHVAAIAEVTDKPIVLYNIPQRVVVNLEPETIARLAEIPNVVAVKQATADLVQAQRIIQETALDVYAGSDELLLPFLELGASGGILVYTHVVGPRVRTMVDLAFRGEFDEARRIEHELRPLVEALAVTSNPIPVKAALRMLGLDVGGLRLPLVEATEAERAQIRSALENAGVLVPIGV